MLARLAGWLGDALGLSNTGSAVAVKTADCLPILGRTGKSRCIHAGWRYRAPDCAQGPKPCGGHRRPARIYYVALAGIGGCCYEVGPEAAAEFTRPDQNGLARIIGYQRRRGSSGRADSSGWLCTGAVGDLSRREKERAGRMFPFVGIAGKRRGGGGLCRFHCVPCGHTPWRRHERRGIHPAPSVDTWIRRRWPGIRPTTRGIRIRDGRRLPGSGCSRASTAQHPAVWP